MSKCRYEIDEQTGEILDNHFVLKPEDIVDRLNYLEEQLKDCIRPKFKIGQECYALLGKAIEKVTIIGCRIKISKMEDENFTMYSITDSQGYACSVMEEQVFATKEEAEQRLKELQGE